MNTITGKHAALWGEDFSFSNWGGTSSMDQWRTLITNDAKARWNDGAVVALMYHACPPTVAESCQWNDVTNKLTDAQWTQIITNGTALNNNWKARLDVIATYLQDLENNGVEVLFRPFHEMNHPDVFWWANRPGPNGSLKLYQITRDYLVNVKGLTNLIWVWNLQDFGTLASDLNNYDPGAANWDVLSIDMYNSDGTGFSTAKYNAMVNKAGVKPIGIGECGTLPSPSLLSTQPRYSYFMGWSELTQQQN
jgi:beta-mannanase